MLGSKVCVMQSENLKSKSLFRVLDALIQRGKPYCESVQNVEKRSGNAAILY